MLHNRKLWAGLTFLFALLLCVCVIAGSLLEQFSSNVDDVLGTKSSQLTSDEGEELYGYYTPEDVYVNTNANGDITSGNSNAIVQAAIDLGEQEGAEGTVLLKNTGVLPLKSGSNVTLLGMRSHVPLLGAGMGTYVVGPVITLEDALSRTTTDWSNSAKWISGSVGSDMDTYSFQGAGYNLNQTAISFYDTLNSKSKSTKYSYIDTVAGRGTVINEASQSDLQDALGTCSGYNDAVIVVVGRPSAEAVDYQVGKSSEDGKEPLELTTNEIATIEYAKSVTNNNGHVIILINSCNSMELDQYKDDEGIGAILNIGFPGCYGMLGVADVLCGTVSPSGGLADLEAAKNLSSPAMQNMGDYQYTNADSLTRSLKAYGCCKSYVIEAENIYTGYRYYETRYEDSVLYSSYSQNTNGSAGVYNSSNNQWSYSDEVTYGFGYGLSYTTFTQEIQTTDVKVNDDRANNSITIDIPVKVTNTGSTYSGKSIVQIYGQAPYYLDDQGTTSSVEKTSIELLGYAKTDTLAPGADETVTVTVDLQNIASYDSTANDGQGGYIMDKGDYYFAVGNGAHDALNNIILTKDSNAKIESEDIDKTGVDVSSLVYKYEFNPTEGEVDQTTFSTSKSGETIENQIPYSDINYFYEKDESKDLVTYLTRSDWSTFPTTYDSVAYTSSMEADLNCTGGNYYQTQTGQDTSAYTWNSTETEYGLYDFAQAPWDYTDEEGNDLWDQLLSQLSINESMFLAACGGNTFPAVSSIGLSEIILAENNGNGIDKYTFSSNLENSDSCPWYVSDGKNDAWCGECFGSSTLLAQAFNPELALRRGEFVGNESLFFGVPIIWGPGLNTHRHPYCGRCNEYYSEDPILCGVTAEYYSYGCAEFGLLDAPKHFAFNDQETNRMGIAPYMTEQRAREVELRAYQIAIESPDMDKIAALAAKADQISPSYTGMFGVMVSYSKIGTVECTCSRGLITGILKNEWGFHGYIVTDLTDDTDCYTAAVYAGITGFDFRGSTGFDTTSNLNSFADYLGDGTQANGESLTSSLYSGDATMMQALKESNKELLWSFAQTNYMNRLSASTHVVKLMTWWRATYIAAIVIFAVLTAAGIVMYVLTYVFRKKEAK